MKMKKPAIRIVLIAAIVAVVLLIALAVAAGAENLSVAQYVMKLTHSEARSPDAIVTVNGKTMTTEALDNARKYSEASGTEFTDMNVYQVINNFVTQTIMLREAEKRGIVVENSEIEAYIAEQKELMRQYIIRKLRTRSLRITVSRESLSTVITKRRMAMSNAARLSC